MAYAVYCDASVQQGGIAYAVGVYIVNTTNNEFQEISQLIPTNSSSAKDNVNEAEVTAVITALKELINLNSVNEPIQVYTDSLSVVQTVNRRWVADTRGKYYIQLCIQAKRLLSAFSSIQLIWIPRKENSKAHKLCNKAKGKVFKKRRKKVVKPPIEERAKVIKVFSTGDNTYSALSSNGKDYYTVNLNEHTCTCRYFAFLSDKQNGKCKHIMAVESYLEADQRTLISTE